MPTTWTYPPATCLKGAFASGSQNGTADSFLKEYIDQICPATDAFRVGLQKLEKFPKVYGPIIGYANTDHPNNICVSCVNVRAEIQRLKDRTPSELAADMER